MHRFKSRRGTTRTHLTLHKVGWDDELPLDISNRWQIWLQDLLTISHIKIPRWSGYTPNCDLLEIHGFVDASNFAYGAVIYLRLIQTQNVLVTMQMDKTRVAPLATLSIPRLKLCAALLLDRLFHTFIESIPLKVESIHLWSDSADVLFWLKDHPSRWDAQRFTLFCPTHFVIMCDQLITPLMSYHEVLSPQNELRISYGGKVPLRYLIILSHGRSLMMKSISR